MVLYIGGQSIQVVTIETLKHQQTKNHISDIFHGITYNHQPPIIYAIKF